MYELTPTGKIFEFLYRTDFINSIKDIEPNPSPETIVFHMMEFIKNLSYNDWNVDEAIGLYQEVYQCENDDRALAVKEFDAKLISEYINESEMSQIDFQNMFGFQRVETEVGNTPELNR